MPTPPASIRPMRSAASATSARGPRQRFSAIESSHKAARESSTALMPTPAALSGRTTPPPKLGATVIVWGKSGSPLVVDDMVVISVGAPTAVGNPPLGRWRARFSGREFTAPKPYNSSLVAYDMKTGAVRWAAGYAQASYASPVVATLAGERQIIVVNESWVTVAPRRATAKYSGNTPGPQKPIPTHLALSPSHSMATACFCRRDTASAASLLAIKRTRPGNFRLHPLWDPPIKKVMKTKMGNVVVRDGFIYGFDDVLLECIELETGAVQWKKRRRPEFGHGQIMLIGNVILVLSETGELALVEANPHEYRELAHIQSLDDANVTWNNPAFAPPYLLVRNAREAACYRLPVKE